MEYLVLLLTIATLVKSSEYYGDLHNSRYLMHFKEIPKRFEIKGGTASMDFKKYFDEIENIAKHENITVVYKIKLEVVKPVDLTNRKIMSKKFKSKKYNIPLKKNSMKLSNFEVMLRKMAEQSGHGNNQNYENYNHPAVTTEADKRVSSTKPIQLKYKPIISKLKTNYTKIIRPVKNRIITLTDLHNSRYLMHFKEIPKRFEIKGGTASMDFKKYFDEIENIAKHENITVVYKIKLEVVKPVDLTNRKIMSKKFKSKKYNIPLKKNSMKLSNFEVMLRKMAEQSGHGNNQNYENYNHPAVTTEADKRVSSTKPIQLKYKPIISKLKTNYTKIIRPVKNRIITLTG